MDLKSIILLVLAIAFLVLAISLLLGVFNAFYDKPNGKDKDNKPTDKDGD